MVAEQNANLIISSLGFSHNERIPTVNHCDGIWCLWNPVNIDLTVVMKENRALHCYIVDNANNKQCTLTTVYAPAQSKDKRCLLASFEVAE